jgi:hypothetical protein
LIPVFEYEHAERSYQQVVSTLGLDSLSTDERINQLLTLPLDEVIATLPPTIPFLPTIDGELVPVRPTFAAIGDKSDQSMPGKQWVDALMVGHGNFDVSLPQNS